MEKLTTAQAAARSGASRFAIHRAIKSGALHPVRDNRGWYLFDAEELDAWSATRAHLVAQSLRDDSATEPATDAAQVEITALRDRLADAEKRAAVAEALAVGKGRLNPAKNAPYSATRCLSALKAPEKRKARCVPLWWLWRRICASV